MSVLPAEGASFAAEAPVVIIGAGAAGLIVLLLLLVIGLVLYFLPTMIASLRSHHQLGAIIVVNLFGWTFIGWVISLAWAVSATRNPTE